MDDLRLKPLAPESGDRVASALRRWRQVPPASVVEAERSLDAILGGVCSSCWPEVAWRFSQMTATGYPVELSFSFGHPTIRYTAEVAGPEVDNHSRLEIAERRLLAFPPGQSLPAALRRRLVKVQAAGVLGWGAWLGGRHDARGSRYKLYAEVPRDAPAAAAGLTGEYVGGGPLIAHRRPRLEGLGFEPGIGRLELYFRVPRLDVADTGVLLARVGLGTRHADLLDLMEVVLARPMRPHLPGHRFGFSLGLRASGEGEAFSLFCYSADVFGSDARARRALLAAGHRLGWPLEAYREISRPLVDVQTMPTHHTVLAFTVVAGGPAGLAVGLVPPAG